MSASIDYSTWQPIENTGVKGDQQRDLDVPGYWAEIGPEDPGVSWSWTILVNGGDEVAGGVVASEDAAKSAVQAWADVPPAARPNGLDTWDF